jgi:hypothetical protein
VAWRRCSRRRGRSRRRSRSCSRSGSFPSADGLLSSSRDGGCGLRPWRVGGTPVRRVPPQLDAAAAPSSSSLSRRAHWRRGKGKPQWGWWLGRLGRSLPLPLKPSAANVGAKTLIFPGLDRPGGQGDTYSLRANQDVGARDVGAKGEVPPWGRARLVCVRAHQPLGVRASRMGVRPIPRARRGRGAGHPVRYGANVREGRLGIGMRGHPTRGLQP